MMNKNYRATDLIELCDMLEGKFIGTWDYIFNGNVNSLKYRLSNLIGLDFALNGEEFRLKLYNDIKSMMFIDSEGNLQYKEF